jgi:DNA polymerase-3 subunit delta'
LRAIEYANGRFEALDREMQRAVKELLSGETDVTQVASAWAKEGLSDRLTWLDLWLTSAARGALAGNADLVTFPPGPMPLPRITGTLNISSLYEAVDRLRALKAQLARTALQRELALESWLIALLQCLVPAKATSTG